MGLFNKLFGAGKKDSNAHQSKFTNFAVSDKLMEEDMFWKIIEATKKFSGDDFEVQKEELAKELHKLIPDDIILFGNRFRYFRGQANTWELWGAIYIIHGGCGDDSFNDFREWVIGQGRDFYYKTINNPESLSEFNTDKMNEIQWEGLGYLPSTVFEEITGQEMPCPFQEQIHTTGEEWKEETDDLKEMFPKLASKFPNNI